MGSITQFPRPDLAVRRLVPVVGSWLAVGLLLSFTPAWALGVFCLLGGGLTVAYAATLYYRLRRSWNRRRAPSRPIARRIA